MPLDSPRQSGSVPLAVSAFPLTIPPTHPELPRVSILSDAPRLPLDSVIGTGELERRLARPPDYQAESQALAALMEALADATGGSGAGLLWKALAETALVLCRAHSAGVSLLDHDGGREIFRWPGAAGVWSQ